MVRLRRGRPVYIYVRRAATSGAKPARRSRFDIYCWSGGLRPAATGTTKTCDEALRERDAARKQLAARNDMLAQVLKEQQY